jgi:predicted AlkP superfamily phosphohydrolase/phosphomutase
MSHPRPVTQPGASGETVRYQISPHSFIFVDERGSIPVVGRASESGRDSERLLIIGWDGADWHILDDLIRRGCLPNLSTMLAEGARGNLESTIPSHSWAAWSTFMTGVNPGCHGVFDFVERHPTDPGKRIPVSSRSIKAVTFFERLSDVGRELRVANVPVTFPPIPLNGRMIAGVAIPPGATYVYPDEWAKHLERSAPWPINGMEWVRSRDDPVRLVKEVLWYVERRTASFEVLLKGNWDVAVCVYVGPDRLQHAFGAQLLPSHPDYPRKSESDLGAAVRAAYTSLDKQIPRLRAAAGPHATTILMSDHGFRPVNRAADLTRILVDLGFASQSRSGGTTAALRKSSPWRSISRSRIGRVLRRRMRVPSTLDWSKTVAYRAAEGGGISLNLAGREPAGTVARTDYERVRDDVRQGLLGWRDEAGIAPIKMIWRREELYSGPHFDLAPDLVVQPNDMWTFSSMKTITADTDWPTGEHRRSGVVVSCGGRTEPGDLGNRDIADIAATALAIGGVSAADLDGRVIDEIAGESRTREPVAVDAVERGGGDELTDDQQEHIAQHLRDLGYIE